jgi:hypothetical protein
VLLFEDRILLSPPSYGGFEGASMAAVDGLIILLLSLMSWWSRPVAAGDHHQSSPARRLAPPASALFAHNNLASDFCAQTILSDFERQDECACLQPRGGHEDGQEQGEDYCHRLGIH